MARGGRRQWSAKKLVGGWGGGSLLEALADSDAASVAMWCLLAAQSSVERVNAIGYGAGVLPLRLLHDLCAGSSGLLMSLGMMWSAVQGSLGLAGSLHIQQMVAVSLTTLARLRYSAL